MLGQLQLIWSHFSLSFDFVFCRSFWRMYEQIKAHYEHIKISIFLSIFFFFILFLSFGNFHRRLIPKGIRHCRRNELYFDEWQSLTDKSENGQRTDKGKDEDKLEKKVTKENVERSENRLKAIFVRLTDKLIKTNWITFVFDDRRRPFTLRKKRTFLLSIVDFFMKLSIATMV